MMGLEPTFFASTVRRLDHFDLISKSHGPGNFIWLGPRAALKIGVEGRNRTYNDTVNSRALYQLSYLHTVAHHRWSATSKRKLDLDCQKTVFAQAPKRPGVSLFGA